VPIRTQVEYREALDKHKHRPIPAPEFARFRRRPDLSRGIRFAISSSVSVEVGTFSVHAHRHRPEEPRAGRDPIASVRFTTEDSRRGDAASSDVASVENEMAKLLERFRLDLEQMCGRSTQKAALVTKSSS
jgi:hypothetical protein